MNFKGIDIEALWTLEQNEFENSKPFYEEHKEKIKNGVITPLREMIVDLSEMMSGIDPEMCLIPSKMVSRVRRDTRFSREKHLYRKNVWVIFMRPKKVWASYPCFWFEVIPGKGYNLGVGMHNAPPSWVEIYRKKLVEKPDEFIAAVKSTQSVGASLNGESYKKKWGGNSRADIEPYYNMKYWWIGKSSGDFQILTSDKLIDELKKNYEAFTPMYHFLLEISDEYMSKFS